MAIRGSECIAHFEHSLGAPIAEFSTLQLVNQAGAWLLSSHPWKFLERPPYRLNIRGAVTVVAGTWDEATLTLTVTDPLTAFSTYTLLEGDQFEVTGGTGADLVFVDVVSSTASSITFRTSIGAAADAQTDIEGTLSLPAARLPADIQELISVQCCGASGANVSLTTHDALLNLKADNTGSIGTDYHGAINWGNSVGVDGGAPIPRLELWPAPSTDGFNSVLITYRAGWARLTSDQAYTNTPDWIDSLVIQAMRSYARGIENHQMPEELARVKTSAMYADALRRDGQIQRKLGRMRGGAVASRMRHGDPHVGNWTIDIPS